MKKFRFGVIGCSSFLKKRIIDAVLKSKYAEIISLASRDLEKAKNWSKEFKIKYSDSYESLFERKDIDAVYISLPIGLHKEWTIKAAKSGKHVLCEKSLAENFDSVKQMVNACKENKIKLYENLVCKNHPQHKKVLNMIKEDKIGEIFSFKGSYGLPPFNEENIRYKKELGGGVLNDAGTYPLSMSRFIFDKEPLSVTCTLYKDKKEVDILGGALLEFPDNKIALIDFGFKNSYQNNYSIWGSKGIIKVNSAYSISEDMSPDIDLISDFGKEKINAEAQNQYAITFDEFCLDILEPRESDFEGMINQARAMEALRVSSNLKKMINVKDIK